MFRRLRRIVKSLVIKNVSLYPVHVASAKPSPPLAIYKYLTRNDTLYHLGTIFTLTFTRSLVSGNFTKSLSASKSL